MSEALDLFREPWLAPEFASTADAAIEQAVDAAELRIDSGTFGTRYTEALARLAAHMLTMAARAQAGQAGFAGVGAVTSIRTGDLSVNWGGVMSQSFSSEDDYYRQTHHGLAFLQIRDSRAEVGFGVIT